MIGVGGFEVVSWNFCRSAVGQLINQTQFGRGEYGFGRREFLSESLGLLQSGSRSILSSGRTGIAGAR